MDLLALCSRDQCRDLVLDFKDVLQRTIETFGPYMVTRQGFD